MFDTTEISRAFSRINDADIDSVTRGVNQLFHDLIAVARLAGLTPYSQRDYDRALRRQRRHARRQRIIATWEQGKE